MKIDMYSLFQKYPKWYISLSVAILGMTLFACILVTTSQYGLIVGFLKFNPSTLFTWRMVGDIFVTTFNPTTMLGSIQLITVLVFGWWILTVYATRQHQTQSNIPNNRYQKNNVHAYTASISAVIGGGCAACGASLLVGVFGAAGSTLISALPLHGVEFALFALGLMIMSAISASRTLQKTQPGVCV